MSDEEFRAFARQKHQVSFLLISGKVKKVLRKSVRASLYQICFLGAETKHLVSSGFRTHSWPSQ